MKPGTELDERVGKLLGWEPVAWEVHDISGLLGQSVRHRHLLRKNAELDAERFGSVHIVAVYLTVSTDGNAMLRAIEAMRLQGFMFGVELDIVDSKIYCVWFTKQHQLGKSARPEHAVALAVCAALEGK